MAADGVEHVQSSCMHVKEQKYYADTAGTRTRQQRVRIHPEFTALTVDRATGQFESMRTLAPPVGQRLGVPHRRLLGLARRAGRDPRAAAGEDEGAVGRVRPLRPRRRPVEPVPDDPRVHRARHRARPRARLRGRLRRDVVRDRRQARQPAVRLAADERHRRPHRRARAVHGRLGRRGRRRSAVGHREGRRPRRLPGRPEHGPAARHAALQRLRLRRLVQPRAGAADGQRVAAAGARRPVDARRSSPASSAASTSSATRAGRSTCSATTSSSPASGSTGSRAAGWPASSATSPTRRRRRTSGARCRWSAARRPTCSAARSTAARPSPGRSRR